MKVAFLDRDGTICLDYPDEDWGSVQHLELIDAHFPIWQRLMKDDYQFIIVSNQYLIGESLISEQQFYRLHNELLTQLLKQGITILDTFICPHPRDQMCDCHKPAPGLIMAAKQKYDIDMSEALIIGDSIHDYQLAQNVGVRFLSVNSDIEHLI